MCAPVAGGRRARNCCLARDVHGATLGIVGFGRIGQAVARRAAGFGMTVLYLGSASAESEVERELNATYVEFDELAGAVRSRDAPRVAQRRDPSPDRWRGAGPHEAVGGAGQTSVVRSWTSGARRKRLRTERSLLPASMSPTRSRSRWTIHSCSWRTAWSCPDIASASHATRGKMAEMAAANLLAGLRGERLPNPVDPEVYEPSRCACGRAVEPARSSRGRDRPGSRRSGGSRTTVCRTMALPDSECPRGESAPSAPIVGTARMPVPPSGVLIGGRRLSHQLRACPTCYGP